MNRLIIPIILLSISGSAVGSDQSIGSAHPMGLEGSRWQLDLYLDESGAMSPVLTEVVVYLLFAEGRVNGSAGCNRHFGGYHTGPDGQLTFSEQMGSTRMLCGPRIDRQEHRYFALLPRVSSYRLEAESLVLLDQEHRPILQYQATEPATLENTRWQALGINNGHGGVVSSATTHLSNALFADGRISGNAGCNGFSAVYALQNGQITIGPAMATRKHCATPEGIMKQERQYLRALEQAHSSTLSPDGLEFRDNSGSLQIRFVVADDRDR